MGKFDASEEEVVQASQSANAHDFISQFPLGYHTIVGEGGVGLSGGQRQRIAIARAFLKNAPILILDEATSLLDSDSESLGKRALQKLIQNRTTLIMAHRLSTIQSADNIIVLNEARIVEQGSHKQLLTIQNGIYRHLYEEQFEDNGNYSYD